MSEINRLVDLIQKTPQDSHRWRLLLMLADMVNAERHERLKEKVATNEAILKRRRESENIKSKAEAA